MSEKNLRPIFYVAAASMMAMLACGPIDLARDILGRLPTATPTASSERFESSIWYVATDGDDSDTCDDPGRACRTIGEVLYDRATDDDVIMVGPGTYAEPMRSGVMLRIGDLNLRIEGSGRESTILDGQDEGTVILISGDSRATVSDLSVRNGAGTAPGNCISHRGSSSVLIENVSVEHCTRSGIEHHGEGELRLVDVSVSDVYWESPGMGGNGVGSFGPLVVEGGEFSDNAGVGVSSGGSLEMAGSRMERNGLDGLIISGEATVNDIHLAGNDIDPLLGQNHAGLLVGGSADARIDGAIIENNDVGVTVREGGQLQLQNATVRGHPRTGVAIEESARVTLRGSEVSDNGSFYAGTSLSAGVENWGHLTVLTSTIEANHNGGLTNYGSLTMRDSTVSGNFGRLSGLFNYTAADAVIERSLVAGQLDGQDGVENRGTMALTNSTVSGNANHGISAITGRLSLSYVTVANNAVAGLSSHRAGEVIDRIENSLIADNVAREDCLFGSIYASPSLGGVNMDSDGSCGFGGGSSTTSPLTFIGLSPLADNGGPTMTHALDSESEAVDAARDACPATDQRGETRPVGLNCDVGAYELGPFPLSGTTEPGAFATITPTPDGGQPTVITDTLCWQGPGPLYEVVSSLTAGTEVEILGRGVEGDWWVIDNPRYQGVRCWAPGEDIEVQPNYNLPNTLFEFPPLPTPTPTPILGCLWYDQNQAEVCYPIDQCPVDFDDSLGACTP